MQDRDQRWIFALSIPTQKPILCGFTVVFFFPHCFTLDCFPYHFTKSFIFKLSKIFQIFQPIWSCRCIFSLIDPDMCILSLNSILGFGSHPGWVQEGCNESLQFLWCLGFYTSTKQPSLWLLSQNSLCRSCSGELSDDVFLWSKGVTF